MEFFHAKPQTKQTYATLPLISHRLSCVLHHLIHQHVPPSSTPRHPPTYCLVTKTFNLICPFTMYLSAKKVHRCPQSPRALHQVQLHTRRIFRNQHKSLYFLINIIQVCMHKRLVLRRQNISLSHTTPT
jgi:hypothetical protein